MNRVLVYLGRFALIVAGYAVAAFAASAFLNVLLYGSLDLTPDEAAGALTGSIAFTIPVVAVFVAYFAFVPSIVAILAGELLGRRDWLFYALAGAAVSLVMLVGLFGAGPGQDGTMVYARLSATVLGAGIVAGVTYWLVAGRMAGEWMERLNPPTSPGPSGS